MRIGSLFSGYGGLDMAVEAVFPDARPAWFCEWDDAPSKILAHHWPDVPNYRDVTAVDWSAVEPVDIITGGYPCQPFSAAGRRKGTDDDRHLWPYVREAVRVLRPRYVVLENVAGHRSLGFDRVLGDMAEDGLHVRWTSVRASDVGAPHHRERLFILATTADSDGVGSQAGQQSEPGSAEVSGVDVGRRSLPDSTGLGGIAVVDRPRGGAARGERDGWTDGDHRSGTSDAAGASEGAPVREGGLPLEPRRMGGALDGRVARLDIPEQWGAYAPAVRRWERLTRPAPAPTVLNTKGKPRLNAAFAEWMMGLPAGHVTGVGLPRTAQLKAIGNGVCPQQAAAALEQLLALEAVTA